MGDSERAGVELEELESVMARLRADQGCPWDREQDLRSLRPYLMEEAFEVLEEMDRVGDGGPWAPLCEELGDLLFQIVFHAQLAAELGEFSLADVSRAISQKLVRRHPHVFGTGEGSRKVSTADQVLQNWAVLKADERKKKHGSEGSALDGVPLAAPALMRAERLTEKASRVGFDWPDLRGARAKLSEELTELDEAIAQAERSPGPAAREALEHELGDVLLSVVNVSRFLKTPPEDALRGALHRFTRRFRAVEAGLRADGVAFGKATLAQLDRHWEAAKAKEAQLPPPREEPLPAVTQLRFALPAHAAAAPYREVIFAQLNWKRMAEAERQQRFREGPLELVFESEEAAPHTAAPSLQFEAPSRDAVRALHARLIERGLALGPDAAPAPEAGGRLALSFRDPSGTRWRYATR